MVMARPSLKNQRREQIINAAMQCVAHHGVSGLTLDKVAEIARLARPLIRHNVGNRQQLIQAVTQHFMASSSEKLNELKRYLPEDLPLTTAVDYLFDTKSSDTTLMLVAEALIAESAIDENIADVMRDWLMDFVENLKALIKQQFPETTKEKSAIVAAGITGIYFTVDSMTPISGLLDFTEHSKEAAFMLINQLP